MEPAESPTFSTGCQAGVTFAVVVALLAGCAGVRTYDMVESLMREGQTLCLAMEQ